MSQVLHFDICVIGAGSAGLTVAAGASQLGASTVLIEAGRMGGDCLNYGCVPSKALLAAAHAAEQVRRSGRYGIEAEAPRIDFRAVHDHVQGVIAAIAPHDSAERFAGLGVRVIRAHARFTRSDEVAAGEERIRARRFVVATGSSPAVPPIPGLDRVRYRTNETIFDLAQSPGRLLVLGGGPIGCELAQAYRRLGAEVAIIEMQSILPRDDPEPVEILRQRLRADGIVLHENARVARVEPVGDGVALEIEGGEAPVRIEGDTLLVAAGRRPAIEGLGLEAAGIAWTAAGVTVDDRLRTTNRRVYAAGDVAGGPQFTHMAAHHAGVVIKNALFRLPARVERSAVPWVTFTDPELAHVGLGEAAARVRGGRISILRVPFAQNDRAQAERRIRGLVKIVATPRGRILGATILGPHAGELIQPWVLAIRQKLGLSAMAGMIAPYPTFGEAGKRAAGSFFMPKLFNERTRRIVRLLRRLG